MPGIKERAIKVISVILMSVLVCAIGLPFNAAFADAQTAVFKRSELSYDTYIERYASAAPGSGEIKISAAGYASCEGEVVRGEDSVKTGDDSAVTWNFNVPDEGLYQLEIDYFPTVYKGGPIERTVLIDGEIPFSEAAFIEFSRVYVDGEITENRKGDDINPEQIEKPRKLTYSLSDPEGFVPGRLSVFLSAGEHSIGLVANREKLELFGKIFVYHISRFG